MGQQNGDLYYDKGALPMSEFYNFLNRTGVFTPPKKKPGVKLLSGMRLILQLNAKDPNTFTSQYISFTHAQYIDMVRTLRLPFRAVEGSAVVGPFFWSAYDVQDDADPHLHIIFRKSDVLKKGFSRGWELMLSHGFRAGLTTGYAKGTDSSKLDKIVDQHLQAAAPHTAHPLVLPAILLGHDLDAAMDDKQRTTRHWLRRLEQAITDRNEINPDERYSNFNLDLMNRELVECHGQVLWKRPQAYLDTLDEVHRAMERFREGRRRQCAARAVLPPRSSDDHDDHDGDDHDDVVDGDAVVEAALDKVHRSMLNRFDFLRQKLKGIKHYAYVSLARLDVQRGALYNIIAQKESKLNLEMAQHQRLLALASKRDSQSMKALSVVGAVFLPATYLASVFSMTFFNFQTGGGGGGGGGGDAGSSSSSDDNAAPPVVSPTLWIYFAITVPVTLVILVVLFWWDKRREKQFSLEEKDAKENLHVLEDRVMTLLRERKTWVSAQSNRVDSV
ncbi:hypothetical protein SPI_06656 [Niveomyces insectorum RCEF 264]|uniref:Mg2+ transporter protein, CorA-like/Zinc transport protein ZntB n=1 Tax=Niveomyces insectorum RCEF 264 TaxID=1081102 RepID=A0A167RGY2_9HYPO|nr:hypothetical protein SPI_06656 [Niveomyces insectorum RCEF 264]